MKTTKRKLERSERNIKYAFIILYILAVIGLLGIGMMIDQALR